ncbi:MAG: 30S ribosomal protein S6 [Chthoniobacterales bacterium]|jgi:small subunit ribosomal protein S6
MTTRRYEILLVLNTKGKEESANDLIEAVEQQLKSAKVEVEQVQRLEKRQFAYISRKQSSGFYANFVVHATPAQIAELQAKWKLDPAIHLQHYQKLKPVAQAA